MRPILGCTKITRRVVPAITASIGLALNFFITCTGNLLLEPMKPHPFCNKYRDLCFYNIPNS
jgi:hypothetical protein